MEMNERMQENVSRIAIMEVISSIKLVSDLSLICKDVITNKQNPKRFAAVFNICCDVLFAIVKCENCKSKKLTCVFLLILLCLNF